LHGEFLAHGIEQLVDREPVQIADHAVVVENVHLVVGEGDGQEALVARVSALVAMRATLGGNACCCGRAMVAVGNVQRPEALESG
jgi:hypothetical protein